jgi:hypothetical protein
MKSIKSFLRKLDVFGVPYSFKYRDKEKYTTALGGLFVVLFIAAALFMGIYYFIPFYNRKNYTTVYYTLTMAKTEVVNFGVSETAFAIGLNCWTGNDGTVASDLFRIDHKYIYYKLEEEYKKNTDMISTHQCTKADFYNRYDETFDGSSIYNYQCMDDSDRGIEGIFTSPIFSYYEFDVYAKNDSQALLDKITDYLTENDCKLQIYYSDNTVDISDYEEPIKSYVEAVFIQLNPTLSIRRNIYFMNQYLYDDNYLIWVFGDDDDARYIKTLFSRYEEYSLYQGTTRAKGSSDYTNYAKVYIRADTKRTDVKRKYQKVMEFYADASSLLIALYDVLIIIFNYINQFWAEQNLSKIIFFFKDLEESGLNVKKRGAQIQELLDITGAAASPSKTSQKNSSKELLIYRNDNSQNLKKKDSKDIDSLQEEVQIYNAKKGKNPDKREKENEKTKPTGKKSKAKNKGRNNENDYYDDYSDNYEKASSNYKGRESKSSFNIKYNMNMKNSNKYKYNSKYDDYNESRTEYSNEGEEDFRPEKVEYDFNICEVLGSTVCRCCQSKELKVKYNLNQKANSILFSKLDIVLYVRNMILLDIMNKTFLGTGIKDVINFLSRPIISLKGKEKNELQIFYNNYKPSDFDKFYNEIGELAQKSDKRNEEKLLISLTNQHLKNLTT